MVWKSGDVTWMPYYQIRHLRTLEEYLDLMGVDNVCQLPNGRGNPPANDSQIFLGAVSYDLSVHMPQKLVTSTDDLKVDTNFFHFLVTFLFSPFFYFLHNNYNLQNNSMNPYPRLSTHSVWHPGFIHISATQYTVTNPDGQYNWNVHVGQIMNYLAFDKHIRIYSNLTNSGTIPLGYDAFQLACNGNMHPDDKHWISSFLPGISDQLESTVFHPSTNPVTLVDFFITPEQCGLMKRWDKREETRALIFED